MKLTIERTGGLVARKVRAEVEGASLTRGQCRAVRAAFRAAGAQEPLNRSETFSYKIVMQGRRGVREVRVGEAAMPADLTSLLPS